MSLLKVLSMKSESSAVSYGRPRMLDPLDYAAN